MKKTKAGAAYWAITAARDVVENLYSEEVLIFEDKRAEEIFYALNDVSIKMRDIWDEELGVEKNEENA